MREGRGGIIVYSTDIGLVRFGEGGSVERREGMDYCLQHGHRAGEAWGRGGGVLREGRELRDERGSIIFYSTGIGRVIGEGKGGEGERYRNSVKAIESEIDSEGETEARRETDRNTDRDRETGSDRQRQKDKYI